MRRNIASNLKYEVYLFLGEGDFSYSKGFIKDIKKDIQLHKNNYENKKLVFILTEYEEKNDLNLTEFENLKCENIKIIFDFELNARQNLQTGYCEILNRNKIEIVNPYKIIFNFPYYFFAKTSELLMDLFGQIKKWNGLNCDLSISYYLNETFTNCYNLPNLHRTYPEYMYTESK